MLNARTVFVGCLLVGLAVAQLPTSFVIANQYSTSTRLTWSVGTSNAAVTYTITVTDTAAPPNVITSQSVPGPAGGGGGPNFEFTATGLLPGKSYAYQLDCSVCPSPAAQITPRSTVNAAVSLQGVLSQTALSNPLLPYTMVTHGLDFPVTHAPKALAPFAQIALVFAFTGGAQPPNGMTVNVVYTPAGAGNADLQLVVDATATFPGVTVSSPSTNTWNVVIPSSFNPATTSQLKIGFTSKAFSQGSITGTVSCSGCEYDGLPVNIQSSPLSLTSVPLPLIVFDTFEFSSLAIQFPVYWDLDGSLRGASAPYAPLTVTTSSCAALSAAVTSVTLSVNAAAMGPFKPDTMFTLILGYNGACQTPDVGGLYPGAPSPLGTTLPGWVYTLVLHGVHSGSGPYAILQSLAGTDSPPHFVGWNAQASGGDNGPFLVASSLAPFVTMAPSHPIITVTVTPGVRVVAQDFPSTGTYSQMYPSTISTITIYTTQTFWPDFGQTHHRGCHGHHQPHAVHRPGGE